MALYFKNLYDTGVSIAFAWFDSGCGESNQNFRKQGWWNLNSGETFLAWNVDLRSVNRYSYFYAEATDGATWSGTGNAWLFITQAAFDQCAFDNIRCDVQADFEELDFNGSCGLTVQLGPDPGQVVLWPEKFSFLLVSSQTADAVADRILRYDGTTGAFIDTFASGGGLDDPLGLAIGPDGNLYVASANTNNILRYNGVTGAFIDVFASGGGLDGPTNLVFGPDQNLYVSGFNNGAILRYNGTAGSFIYTFASGGGLGAPRGLLFGPDNNLYVVDYDHAAVLRYDGVTGSFLGTFVPSGSGGLYTPSDLVFGPDGNLYVSGGTLPNMGIFRYNRVTGDFMGIFASVGELYPSDLVFGPDQNLYVTVQGDTNGVLRFNGTTGALIDTFVTNGSGGLQNPFGLTFQV